MDHLQWIMDLQNREAFPRMQPLGMMAKSPAEYDGQPHVQKQWASGTAAAESILRELTVALSLHGSLQTLAAEKTVSSAAENAPEHAAYAHVYGGTALGAGPSMADISRFFERDARRFG